MDLLATCPFRSLMALFLAVPFGVISAIYAAEFATGVRQRLGSGRSLGPSASDRPSARDQPPISPVAAPIP